jgi:predicted membrane channel-forming protein YqfA (hemolysin III family)
LNLIRVMPAKGQDTRMQSSQTIARLAGPVFAVVGIGMLTSQAAYREMASQFVATFPLIYFSGILILIAGLAILNVHNLWVGDWRTSITVLGWVLTCIGAFRIIAPPFVSFMGVPLLATGTFFVVTGFLFLGVGAFFTFKGYVA